MPSLNELNEVLEALGEWIDTTPVDVNRGRELLKWMQTAGAKVDAELSQVQPRPARHGLGCE